MNNRMNKKPLWILLALCLLLAFLPGMSHTARAEETAGEENGESFFTATQTDAVDPSSIDNGIPVLYLNIDENEGTIQEMIESPKHEKHCIGKLSIDVPAGFHYVDFPDLTCESVEDLAMDIRGRGNSTWERSAKKPFKITLDSKADLFGLGENKHWVLVANAMDVTLLKNRMTAWLGDQMGFAFTPRGVPVDVVLSGQIYGTHYIGSYYLSENVRVGKNRLEIKELDEEDTDPQKITGGYLLQQSSQIRPGSPDKFETSRGAKWATHTPSFDTGEDEEDDQHGPFGDGDTLLGDGYENKAQQEYIQNHIQYVEDVMFDGTTDYRDLMDITSAAKYWLFNTMSLNSDAYGTGSTYIYKNRDGKDSDGSVPSKIYWGPLWDFDFAWNVNYAPEGMEYYHVWLKPMFCDRTENGFIEEVYRQWETMKGPLAQLIEDGGILDQYAQETLQSAECNALIWPQEDGLDYLNRVKELKDWIRRRIEWLNAHFDQVNDLAHKVTFLVDGETYSIAFLGYDEELTGKEDYPEKEGYTFLGWQDEDGNVIDSARRIEKDMTLTAKYARDEEVTHAQDIAMSKNCDIVAYNVHIYTYYIHYTVIPEDADDKIIEWSSSDESLATVDADGCVIYNGSGEFTFTAKMKNGKIRTFTLTVTQGEIPVAEEIFPDEEVIYMTVGSQRGCSISTNPSPAQLYGYEYISGDEAVVTAGENGVLTAVGLGETRVIIKARCFGPDDEEITLETAATVIVTEPPVYTVTEGASCSWKKDSAKGLQLTVKRSVADETCFGHFAGVMIDDTPLEQDRDFTAAPGSTIVTIRPDVLEACSTGKHTVTILFDDGQAQVSLEIEGSAPPTGDAGGALWAVLMALALIGFSLAFGLHRKKAERTIK